MGSHDGNIGVHRGQCVGTIGRVGAREEKEKGKEKGVETDTEEMGDVEEVEELGETGAGVEKDRDREMEVEETLKEVEKSADEAVMEE